VVYCGVLRETDMQWRSDDQPIPEQSVGSPFLNIEENIAIGLPTQEWLKGAFLDHQATTARDGVAAGPLNGYVIMPPVEMISLLANSEHLGRTAEKLVLSTGLRGALGDDMSATAAKFCAGTGVIRNWVLPLPRSWGRPIHRAVQRTSDLPTPDEPTIGKGLKGSVGRGPVGDLCSRPVGAVVRCYPPGSPIGDQGPSSNLALSTKPNSPSNAEKDTRWSAIRGYKRMKHRSTPCEPHHHLSDRADLSHSGEPKRRMRSRKL